MTQIAKTQTIGAIVKDSLFEDSVAFYGRWKSSHSVLHNCTFRGNGNPQSPKPIHPPPTRTNLTQTQSQILYAKIWKFCLG